MEAYRLDQGDKDFNNDRIIRLIKLVKKYCYNDSILNDIDTIKDNQGTLTIVLNDLDNLDYIVSLFTVFWSHLFDYHLVIEYKGNKLKQISI
jgi:hypothetical protein